MRNWKFEVYGDYTPTEHTVCLLACSVVVIGIEIRRSFPADDPQFPSYGAAVGMIVLNWWIGWFKYRSKKGDL